MCNNKPKIMQIKRGNKMYKKLEIYRAIMRIYSFCNFDLQTCQLTHGEPTDALHMYFSQIQPLLKKKFSDEGLVLYPTGVNSCFNDKVRTELEVFFLYEKEYYNIPEEILICLQKYLNSKKLSVPHYENSQLYWAYSGRFLDKGSNARFVTDGLQYSNKIAIDFITYTVAPHDALHHRIIHELLHILGVEENQMNELILEACRNSYELTKPFIQSVIQQAVPIGEQFMKIAENISYQNPTLVKKLLSISDDLYNVGFPVKMDTPLFATMYMPSQFFPNPECKGFHILFM